MGLIYRNIIKSGVLEYLRKAGFRIVILTSAFKDQEFINEVADDNIMVEELVSYSPKGLEKLVVNFRNNLVYTETTKVKLAIERDNKHYTTWIFKILIYRLFGKFQWLKNILEKIENTYFTKDLYKDLFAKYKPDLVFSTHLVYHDDIELVKEAKKAGIKTIGMVQSWDNLTSKGAVHIKTDKLIVWNEIMKKEAIDLAGFKAEDIFLSGVPQFDFYFRKDKIVSREEFFAKNNLDPNKKLIVYAAWSKKTAPYEPEVLAMIDDFINKKQLASPCELLIRLHPKAFLRKEYDWLEDLKQAKWEAPGRYLESLMDVWLPTDEDIWHMVNEIYHADLVMTVCSTFTLDAWAFDKPVINIKFDGNQKDIPYGKSVERFFDYTHYIPIIKSGGVKITSSKEELLQHINEYLKNPALDSDGRKKGLKEQTYIYDSQSAERIANYLITQLS